MHHDPHDPLTPDEPDEQEAAARRLLGLNATWATSFGTGLLLGGGRIGRATMTPAPLVRLVGLAALGWAGVLGVGALSEDWVPPTRRAANANVAIAAVLAGLAVARGKPIGRLMTLGTA